MSSAKSATAPTEDRGCLKCAGGGRVQSINSSHSTDPDAHEGSEEMAAPCTGTGGAVETTLAAGGLPSPTSKVVRNQAATSRPENRRWSGTFLMGLPELEVARGGDDSPTT